MTAEQIRTNILNILADHEALDPKLVIDGRFLEKKLGVEARRIAEELRVLEHQGLIVSIRSGDARGVRLFSPPIAVPSVQKKSRFYRRRFSDWSRGDWFSAIGVVIGFIACLAAVLAVPGLPKIFDLDKPEAPILNVQLQDPLDGFQILVKNVGRSAAPGIYVDLSVWLYGAPGAYTRQFVVHDLGPGSDSTIREILYNPNLDKTFPGVFERDHSSLSGFMVIGCTKCNKPRAWAFHITIGLNNRSISFYLPHSIDWRVQEFRYPEDTPPIGSCVDVPKGACADTMISPPSDIWPSTQ